MRKLVYLFELDSVKKKRNEIIAAERAILNEIVQNGNYVAISFNQLTDSQAFAKLLRDEKTYPLVLSLFERGALRVSLYGRLRTPSHYFQNAVEKSLSQNSEFFFSNLPLNGNVRLLETVKNALRYSDLSELAEMSQSAKSQDEKELLEYISRFIKLILSISVNELGTNPPRASKSRPMREFIEFVLDRFEQTPDATQEEQNATRLLRSIYRKFQTTPDLTAQIDNRSCWLPLITKSDADDETKFLAEEIVHLCYNYTVEDSVANVAKHYDEQNFAESFWLDFQTRFALVKNERESSDSNDLAEPSLPCWQTAARVAECNLEQRRKPISFWLNWRIGQTWRAWQKERAKSQTQPGDVKGAIELGGYSLGAEQTRWKRCLFRKVFGVACCALAYILLYLVVAFILAQLEDAAVASVLDVFLVRFVLIGFFCAIASLVAKMSKIPDILESFYKIIVYLYDYFSILFRKYESYERDYRA